MNIDALLEWANYNLNQSDSAKTYLQGRGVSVEQMNRHSLGFISGDYSPLSSLDPNHSLICDDDDKKHVWCDTCRFRLWSSSWASLGEGQPKTQIVGRRIINSIVFPLTSYSGQRIGFQTRSLVEKNYDTFAISRRPEGFFFCSPHNIQSIWSTKEVVLVEGSCDHLVFERLVGDNVLALTTSGTGKLQLQFLKRFARRIILCLDLDKAGRDGCKSFINHNSQDFEILDLKYPKIRDKDKDVGDFWKSAGDESFRRFFFKSLGR